MVHASPTRLENDVVVERLKSFVVAMESDPLRALDHRILDFLYRTRGAAQVALASELKAHDVPLTPSTISRLVSRLESRGYVKRASGPDHRTKRVLVTRKGVAAIKAFDDRVRSALASVALDNALPDGPLPVLMQCPACTARLRLPQYGARVRNRCPECGQQFSLHFKGGQCHLVLQPVDVMPDSQQQKSPFEVLGVKPGSSRHEILQAWRGKMKSYHPDKFHHLGADFVRLANIHSQRVNAAREALADKP